MGALAVPSIALRNHPLLPHLGPVVLLFLLLPSNLCARAAVLPATQDEEDGGDAEDSADEFELEDLIWVWCMSCLVICSAFV